MSPVLFTSIVTVTNWWIVVWVLFTDRDDVSAAGLYTLMVLVFWVRDTITAPELASLPLAAKM